MTKEHTQQHERPSNLQFFYLTVARAGVQFAWSIQIGQITPLLRRLGLPSTSIGWTWLAGPVSGLVVQPVVGVLSDSFRSKYGRRRPFIFFGAIFVAIALLLMAYASAVHDELAAAAAEANIDQTHSWPLVLAIFAFWILDLSNNAISAPLRALMADQVPTPYQASGHAWFSGMVALGNFTGYMVGFMDVALLDVFPVFRTPVRALFSLGAMMVVACVSITVYNIHEPPTDDDVVDGASASDVTSTALENAADMDDASTGDDSDSPDNDDEKTDEKDELLRDSDSLHHRQQQHKKTAVQQQPQQSQQSQKRSTTSMLRAIANAFGQVLRGMKDMPSVMRKLVTVQFFISVGRISFLMFGSTWVAENVFHGSVNASAHQGQRDAFDAGVRFASLALAGNSVITFLSSTMVPSLTARFGQGAVLSGGQIVFGLCLLSTAWIEMRNAAFVMIALIGITWATIMVIPFSIVTQQCASASDRGLYLGVLNVFIVIPQLCVAVASGTITGLSGGDVGIMLVLGGIAAFGAAALAYIMFGRRSTAHPMAVSEL
jgi:solute carrier family 45, member 1/2/4